MKKNKSGKGRAMEKRNGRREKNRKNKNKYKETRRAGRREGDINTVALIYSSDRGAE